MEVDDRIGLANESKAIPEIVDPALVAPQCGPVYSPAIVTPESSYSGQRPLGLTAATTARNCSKVI